jgi:sulfur-oxidizing protein SoxY
MNAQNRFAQPNRRTFLMGAGAGLVGVLTATAKPARALDGPLAFPTRVRALVEDRIGKGDYYFGKLLMDLPIIAESGFSVPVTFRVDTPQDATDHVQRILAVAPVNPEGMIADYVLGPRAGKAEVSTRVRIAKTQTVYAVAMMSDGMRWGTSVELQVTFGACVDEVQDFQEREFLKVQRLRGLE